MPKRKGGFEWTPEFDDLLIEIEKSEDQIWNERAEELKKEIIKIYPEQTIFPSGKQCNQRWSSQLDPSVSRESFTPEEIAFLNEKKAEGLGFAEIGRLLKHPADQVKNTYNCIKNSKERKEISTYETFFTIKRQKRYKNNTGSFLNTGSKNKLPSDSVVNVVAAFPSQNDITPLADEVNIRKMEPNHFSLLDSSNPPTDEHLPNKHITLLEQEANEILMGSNFDVISLYQNNPSFFKTLKFDDEEKDVTFNFNSCL